MRSVLHQCQSTSTELALYISRSHVHMRYLYFEE